MSADQSDGRKPKRWQDGWVGKLLALDTIIRVVLLIAITLAIVAATA